MVWGNMKLCSGSICSPRSNLAAPTGILGCGTFLSNRSDHLVSVVKRFVGQKHEATLARPVGVDDPGTRGYVTRRLLLSSTDVDPDLDPVLDRVVESVRQTRSLAEPGDDVLGTLDTTLELDGVEGRRILLEDDLEAHASSSMMSSS